MQTRTESLETHTRIEARALRPPRDPLSPAERTSLWIAAVGVFGFVLWGFARNEPSTLGYLCSVVLLAVGLAAFRQRALPDWLAYALAALALGHLAGGLVTVGGDVLYNAHPDIRIFQYDHVFHASASAVATYVLWTVLAPELDSRSAAIVVSILGALGVGALNELVEFTATLAHHGQHVGGYMNTGWDLVADTVGAVTAGIVIALAVVPRRQPA
jgi:hypothetical protein